jgi:ribosomal protein S18 acetylase RimI-like enzyme
MSENQTDVAFEKQYVLKSLDTISFPKSNLSYKSLRDLDEAIFIDVLGQCLSGISARDFDVSNPEKQFRDLISFAGTNFQPQNWFIALMDQDVAGMVLPQSYGDDSPGDGSLFFIGVVPKFRRQGLGRSLHAKGLAVLSSMGLKRYIGSTDVLNSPMLRVFKANGCEFYKIRLFDHSGEPIGWKE